jgi:hypothetical protein
VKEIGAQTVSGRELTNDQISRLREQAERGDTHATIRPAVWPRGYVAPRPSGSRPTSIGHSAIPPLSDYRSES